MKSKEPKREPVDFDYTALNWDFIRAMAWIPMHAAEKYGSWAQYKEARLCGEKSPVNHAFEHLAKYLKGEPYDKRDGDVRWHLVAAAYNCMMEFYYRARFGHESHPLSLPNVAETLMSSINPLAPSLQHWHTPRGALCGILIGTGTVDRKKVTCGTCLTLLKSQK